MNKRLLSTLLIVGIYSQIVFAQMSVKITEPSNKAKFDPCTTIHFATEVTEGDVKLRDVRLYYNDGLSIGRTSAGTFDFDWKNVPKGSYWIYAVARDTEGNLAYSDTIWVEVGSVGASEMVINPSFDCKLQPWAMHQNNGATATATVYNDGYFDDASYVMLEITNPLDTEWYLQFAQTVGIEKGHEYEITFMADAFEKRNMTMLVQADSDPYTEYITMPVEIDGAEMFGPFVFTSDTTDPKAVLKFNIGANPNTILLDEVHMRDYSVTGVKEISLDPAGQVNSTYELLQAYPNPFNMNTRMQFSLSQDVQVNLEIFNMLGQKVRTLAQGNYSAGTHTMYWNATDDMNDVVPTGVYIYRLQILDQNNPVELTRKVVLIK